MIEIKLYMVVWVVDMKTLVKIQNKLLFKREHKRKRDRENNSRQLN